MSTGEVLTGCQKDLFERVTDCLRSSQIAPLPPTALATTPIAAAVAGLSASHTGRVHEVSGGDPSGVGAGSEVANIPSQSLPQAGVSLLISGAAEQVTLCNFALRSTCVLRGLNDISTNACRFFAYRCLAADLRYLYLLLCFSWVCASGAGDLKLTKVRPCLVAHRLGRCSVKMREALHSSFDLQSAMFNFMRSPSFTSSQQRCKATSCQGSTLLMRSDHIDAIMNLPGFLQNHFVRSERSSLAQTVSVVSNSASSKSMYQTCKNLFIHGT